MKLNENNINQRKIISTTEPYDVNDIQEINLIC